MKMAAGKKTCKRKWIAGILAGTFLCAALSGCGDDSAASEDDSGEYTRNFFAMDTFMTLTAYGDAAQEAVEAGVAEIERLDALFSTGDEGSEIYALNAAGGGKLSEETAMLIERSAELYDRTEGLFDISIYPVMKLWGFADGEYRVPEPDELAAALALVDASNLTVTEEDGDTVLYMEESMQIDLGGIVKGYADDRIAEIFAEYGVEDAIINLGGDVRLMGRRSDGTLWRVGIQDPEDSDGYLGGLALTDTSVVTSGGYERYFEDEETGVRYHHIIDPRTGISANNGLISVSVVSDDGAMADALSTALFIMGSEDAVEYCAAHAESDGFDALLMTEEREIFITENLADSFIDINGDTELHRIEAHAQ